MNFGVHTTPLAYRIRIFIHAHCNFVRRAYDLEKREDRKQNENCLLQIFNFFFKVFLI